MITVLNWVSINESSWAQSLVGSVLAKEGSLPDVSHFVSGAFKIVLRQLKQEEPAKSGSRPRNDTLTAQVNSLRHELQLLASNRPITIISTGGSGGKKYGWIIIIGVIGYGYVWWKGWKLPDFMFATRRSLSDACNNVGSQIDGFYESLSGTKRELGSEIDRMDRTLDASTIIIKETGREVNELRDGTANMKDDVRQAKSIALREIRISRLEELELCMLSVGSTKDFKSPIRHEPSLALPSTSSVPALEPAPVTPSLRSLSLPPASPRESQLPSTPNGAQQSNGPLQHTQSMSGLKDINESSNGTPSGEAMGNTSSGLFSMFSMPRIGRTRSAVNAVPANLTGAQYSSPKAFLILDKLSSILHQGQLAFQTASAPFASEPLAIPTATAPVRRSAAHVSNLNPFASRPARVQLASSSRPARVPAQLEVQSFGGPVSTIY
ncbi:hypothetical protein F2Q69_00008083 [Brassica cretica]|uniref:DUF1664 domain-containing protein n=1 Tax=Brassica cretica TaxID=69181 RepID=A0A8S9P7V5_BRACR|nr:hypothetical protein F2Q69_00008083 [Brassica cretica]